MVVIDHPCNIEQPVVHRGRTQELQPRLAADTGNIHFTRFDNEAEPREQLGTGKSQLGRLNPRCCSA